MGHLQPHQTLVVTEDQLADMVSWLLQHDVISVDTETTGLQMWRGCRVAGISFTAGYDEDRRSFYIPFRHGWNGEYGPGAEYSDPLNWDPEVMVREMAPLLWAPDKLYLFFNAPFDVMMLWQDCVGVPQYLQDVILAAHMVDENEPSFALKRLSDKYLGGDSTDPDTELHRMLVEAGYVRKNSKKEYVADKGAIARLTAEQVAPYAMGDTELTYDLHDFYLPFLEGEGMRSLWEESGEYCRVLIDLQIRGIQIDAVRIRELRDATAQQIAITTERLRKLLDAPDLNPGAPAQLAKVLHVTNTKKETLETLIEQYKSGKQSPLLRRQEAMETVLVWRAQDRANTAYYDAYPKFVDDDWILHANYKIHGTVATRLSASSPNVTAVPREGDARGYRVKECFVPRPGYMLVEVDYAQAELRQVSSEAGEDRMYSLLNSGADLHTETAKEMSVLAKRHVERPRAKNMNFGVVYGLGIPGFADQFRIPTSEARVFVQAYHDLYPHIREYNSELESKAQRDNYIQLWTGRRRHFDTSGCDCGTPGCHSYHKSMSNRIQGGVAEMMRVAMLELDRVLAPLDVRMLLQVHDSLLLEIPFELYEKVVKSGWLKSILEHGPNDIFLITWPHCPPKIDMKWSAERWSAMGHNEEEWMRK